MRKAIRPKLLAQGQREGHPGLAVTRRIISALKAEGSVPFARSDKDASAVNRPGEFPAAAGVTHGCYLRITSGSDQTFRLCSLAIKAALINILKLLADWRLTSAAIVLPASAKTTHRQRQPEPPSCESNCGVAVHLNATPPTSLRLFEDPGGQTSRRCWPVSSSLEAARRAQK